ncbi:MAG: hypothetical protein LBO82_08400 [Synergistaceae bacterium]|jgi:hypothetical protein|nr:hypothetical protein [Synergistaceae bacterium]
MNTQKARGKTEVLVAVLILATAIFAGFGSVGRALSITAEVRGRMKNYSRLEYLGLLSAASGNIAKSDDADLDPPADIAVPITIGADTRHAELTCLVYKRKPHAGQTKKTKGPVFVVFLKR